MKHCLLTTMAMLFAATASAQTTFDEVTFEDGKMPENWTAQIPESPYANGGFSVVSTSTTTETSLKAENVGVNDCAGSYVLKSVTGGKSKTKADSDNWFTSPKFTVADNNIFSFRMAANCSYSGLSNVTEENRMKMDVVVISGDDKTVLGTIAPANYFAWKQYSFDLSAFAGKEILVAFHDYGTPKTGVVLDFKYIDDIKLSNVKSADYIIESATTLYGQAEFTAPYTINVANYGLAKGKFVANYKIGEEETVSEEVESDIANGKSVEYTFKKNPVFTAGTSNTFKVWLSAEDDAMESNNSLADQTIELNSVASLPYSVMNDTVLVNNQPSDNANLMQNEFSAASTSSSKAGWTYYSTKYYAWIYALNNNAAKYQGIAYLYTNKAFALPKGKVTLSTIGTATGPETEQDMHYEVYIAKYGSADMVNYATKVGESGILDIVSKVGVVTTDVVLDIPEAGNYVIGIRPVTAYKSNLSFIGYSLQEGVVTSVAKVSREMPAAPQHAYTLSGVRAGANTKGIVVIGGKKFFRK